MSMWNWLRRLLRIRDQWLPMTDKRLSKLIHDHVEQHREHIRREGFKECARSLREALAAKPQTDELLEQIKKDHARNVPDTVDEHGNYLLKKGHWMGPELSKWVHRNTGGLPPDSQRVADTEQAGELDTVRFRAEMEERGWRYVERQRAKGEQP